MGTFTYMSPEQVRGRALDARSDLFSLGVVLYEMLTGRLPFEGETATDVADRILNGDPPALSRFNYAVPERLDAIVLKALAKDPAFRYQSARELYIDLHAVGRWLDDPNASRSRRIASGAIVAPTADARPEAPPAIAVMTFGNTTREPGDDWIGSGIAETVTADLRERPRRHAHRPDAGPRRHQAPERAVARARRRTAGDRDRPPARRLVHHRRRAISAWAG